MDHCAGALGKCSEDALMAVAQRVLLYGGRKRLRLK